jgi:hypothetical protein
LRTDVNESSKGGFFPSIEKESITSTSTITSTMGTEQVRVSRRWRNETRERRRGGGRLKKTIGRGYPLESRNGMLLFGLTVAFLFTMIQGIWPLKNSEEYGKFSRRHGSETVNPCARPIHLIRAVAMKRLFLEAF